MRGLLLFLLGLIIGVVAGIALTRSSQPALPSGVSVPQQSDVRVTLADRYLSRLAQQRISLRGVQVSKVRITSVPPNRLVARAQVAVGPVVTPIELELQPYASNGAVQVRPLAANVSGLPIPQPAAQVIASGIDSSLRSVVGGNTRVTGVRVIPAGLEIWADYR